MPNWNYATIFIKGSKKALDEIEATGFDFQKIRPMPQELYDDINGKNLGGRLWKKDDDKGTLESWQTHCKTKKEKDEMKERYEEFLKDFETVCGWIKIYGVNGWHDWANEYWGTKWNPFPNRVQMKRNFETELEVELTTAWSLPLELLRFMAQKYKVKIVGDTINQDGMEQIPFALEK